MLFEENGPVGWGTIFSVRVRHAERRMFFKIAPAPTPPRPGAKIGRAGKPLTWIWPIALHLIPVLWYS